MTSILPLIVSVVLNFTTAAGVQQPNVVCSPTIKQYFAAINAPQVKLWPSGVGGDADFSTMTITLTPQECANLAAVAADPSTYTLPRGYSVLVLAHEITHMVGLKSASTYGWIDRSEQDADCGAAQRGSAVAYLLGVRSKAFYAMLSGPLMRHTWGYDTDDQVALAECWT